MKERAIELKLKDGDEDRLIPCPVKRGDVLHMMNGLYMEVVEIQVMYHEKHSSCISR